ncbi:TolC family protein [Chryseobacterium sp. BIGb0232]|uniref:TolC family protein n=1 Tax=Chryseobacterium sp. BIGb0232 TaxID=2940598 RepID=UPI000F4A1DE2|nr:TolC family protein [Chryseobacterium sp. BIGb0232]ROS19584.1 NodT family efflux transporter outer membrane factor (OMF) lipoprotein [Chryseobacterium nakagawai]
MVSVKKIAFIIFLSTLLNSCSIGKKYSRPNIAVPEHFRDQSIENKNSINLKWKTFFKDPVLVQLIEKALEKNAEISIAIISLEQVELNYRQSKQSLLPIIGFTAGSSRSWISKNSLNGSLVEQFSSRNYIDDFDTSVRLSWEADIWGKAKLQKEQALIGYFMQKENLSALKTRIITQVAQAYYNLIALDEQLKIAQTNVFLSDKTLEMTKLQYQYSLTSSVGVAQSEAQKKTAEMIIPVAKKNIAVQENALSILCGQYPNAIERAGYLESTNTLADFETGVPVDMLANRPDVKAAEYDLMISNVRTNLAKIDMYPTFSITASSGLNSFNFSNWINIPGSLIKNMGVNLTQPIFNKAALKTAYKIAELNQEKLDKKFKQTIIIAAGEVADALAIIKNTDEQLFLATEKGKSLTKASEDVDLLYKNAKANYLEVIIAQNNALENELEIIAMKKEKLTSIIVLYRSLGGGSQE